MNPQPPRIYRLLLLLYPRWFREHYGEALLAALDDRRRDARRAGRWRLVRFDAGALKDMVVNAAAETIHSRGAFLASFAQDAKFALRMLRRRPALSFFSAVTLALGIGAVTAVVALVDAVMIRPLPYPDPTRIVSIRGTIQGRTSGISYENLLDIRDQASSIAAASPFFAQSVNLTGVPEPDRLRGGFVTSDFFAVLGVAPSIGVAFSSRIDTKGSERVAILTDRLWKVRFGGRHDILGTQLHLNNAPFTVIGVMPPSFRFPIDDVEVFLPFWTTTAGIDRGNHNYIAVARLESWATPAIAAEEATAIAASLEGTYPETNRGLSATVEPFRDALTEDLTVPLRMLAGMIAIILAAACANVAGLQLGETARRQREIAVRVALGAGRVRIARQLVIESVARAVIGAVLGVLAAGAAVGVLAANTPTDVFGIENVSLSPLVIAVAALTTLCAGIAAGLPPALQWARASLFVHASGTRVAGDTATRRLRSGLVVCQIAFAAVLLVAAGLTTRSFMKLTAVDVGFDPSGLLTMEYRLPGNKYRTPEAQSVFHDRVLERVRSLPGVVDAAGVRGLPFSGNGSASAFRLAKGAEPARASFNTVSARYFETMRIPLRAGRVFAENEGREPVIVVSRALAERIWPAQDAVGRTVYFEEVDITATVIGVVGDVRHRDLAEGDGGTIYVLQRQNPGLFNTLAVRTRERPMDLADDVRRAVWSVDADQPVWKIRTVESLIEASVAPRRVLLQLVAFFGFSAAALAVLGLYGVVASAVATRTREIGVRVALGASSRGVLTLVLGNGLRLAAAGIVLGMVGAFVAGRLMRSFLFGVGAADPLTFGAAGALLLTAALLACAIPAARALRVDPADALREG
jgi:predicted permease